MTKWEYMNTNIVRELQSNKLPIELSTIRQLLNKYGLEGWELVNVVTAYSEFHDVKTWEFVAYFKREIK